ncbi:mitochondrial carrier domain-containing protein [Lipomyces starkeyi]
MPAKPIRETILVNKPGPPVVPDNRYIGFVAGIFSGVTNLFVGYPFDTIKVRLQRGPLDCFLQSTRKEGFRALYKGATPPLLGWMVMDSVLGKLLPQGHANVGIIAGWTDSFVAALIEYVKVGYRAGIRGQYRGPFSTMVFRSYFFFLWGSYDIMTHLHKENRNVRIAAINFWAGGLSAPNPSDAVKQTIITNNVTNSRHKTWIDAARYVYNERGFKGFFRGFVPIL